MKNEILMLIAAVVLVTGVHLTWSGIHDIDNAWNVMKLNSCDALNIKLVDIRIDGTVATEADMYMGGLSKLIYGTLQSVIGALFLGYGTSKSRRTFHDRLQ